VGGQTGDRGPAGAATHAEARRDGFTDADERAAGVGLPKSRFGRGALGEQGEEGGKGATANVQGAPARVPPGRTLLDSEEVGLNDLEDLKGLKGQDLKGQEFDTRATCDTLPCVLDLQELEEEERCTLHPTLYPTL